MSVYYVRFVKTEALFSALWEILAKPCRDKGNSLFYKKYFSVRLKYSLVHGSDRYDVHNFRLTSFIFLLLYCLMYIYTV